MFLERLRESQACSDVFLLLSILSVSARFTPTLIQKYGSGMKASSHFVKCSRKVALLHAYDMSVRNVQAFFLLGLADWGSGDKERSWVCGGFSLGTIVIICY